MSPLLCSRIGPLLPPFYTNSVQCLPEFEQTRSVTERGERPICSNQLDTIDGIGVEIVWDGRRGQFSFEWKECT